MTLNTILLISFLLLLTFGTLLHFTHNWFKKGLLLHIFSAVNESTWEHMKLLLAPTCIVIILQYLLLRNSYSNILYSGLILLVVQILTIPLLYEPLRLIVRKVPFLITIGIFILAIIFGVLVEYIILKNGYALISEPLSLLIVICLLLLFGLFSYYPPKIFLFKDPVTGRYGDSRE